jgi:hypothetical protein
VAFYSLLQFSITTFASRSVAKISPFRGSSRRNRRHERSCRGNMSVPWRDDEAALLLSANFVFYAR